MNRFLDTLTPSLSQTIIAFLVRRVTSQLDFLRLKFDVGTNAATFGNEAILLSQLLMLSEFVGGNRICSEGEECSGLYILMHGSLRGFILDCGKKIYFEHDSREGSVFGEISYFMNSKRSATIMTETRCSCLFLKIEYRQLFYQGSPNIYRSLR